MLENAYFVAKIGADTAENEQHFAEMLPKIGNYPTGPPEEPASVRPMRRSWSRPHGGGGGAQLSKVENTILRAREV